MKYKCLILDHDDTVVNSSASIHYPSFIEYLKIYRPGMELQYTFESFIEKNFIPGILSLLCDEVGLNDEELKKEEEFWNDFVRTRTPKAYLGMKELIAEFRRRGGIVAVSSHSMSNFIKRDYEANDLPMPDVIYGWDMPRENRKPSPFTVNDLIARYGFAKEEIVMVDDLKAGFDMARSAGIDFVAAGWAYDVPTIREFMKNHSDYYFESIEDLERLLFD